MLVVKIFNPRKLRSAARIQHDTFLKQKLKIIGFINYPLVLQFLRPTLPPSALFSQSYERRDELSGVEFCADRFGVDRKTESVRAQACALMAKCALRETIRHFSRSVGAQ